VGEAMAIGRTFKEALQKALRSMEIGLAGLENVPMLAGDEALRRSLATPGPDRVFHIKQAFQRGFSPDEIYQLSMIDPWFLDNIKQIVEFEYALVEAYQEKGGLDALPPERLAEAKRHGFSDVQLAKLLATTEKAVRDRRRTLGIRPVFKSVDTCAAEFEAFTPYYYSTYEREDESHQS
jgi:carbamoyl-phosphate synthase large subunit